MDKYRIDSASPRQLVEVTTSAVFGPPLPAEQSLHMRNICYRDVEKSNATWGLGCATYLFMVAPEITNLEQGNMKISIEKSNAVCERNIATCLCAAGGDRTVEGWFYSAL